MRAIRLKSSRRLLSGHLWIFSNEVSSSLRGFQKGELVEILDRGGGFLGIGYVNPNSLIAIRVLSRRKVSIDVEFFKRRFSDALAYRKMIYPEEESYRVVFSDSDLLPGLIVDRFGDVAVVQILTAGMEALKDMIFSALETILNPDVIVVKNDSPFRELEGLTTETYVLKGELNGPTIVEENGYRFEIDIPGGQKTGFFLDQRENRTTFSRLVKGGIGLDLFSYVGAWGIQIASKAEKVICVDSSKNAVNLIKNNADLNNLTDKVEALCDDVFDFLDRERIEKNKYDFIVLDPPAFVKSKASLKRAISGYRALNANAILILKKGGLLATSSCSHHISPEGFLDILRYAAKVTNRYVRVIEFKYQAKDHPFLLAMPETRYLKCAILQVM